MEEECLGYAPQQLFQFSDCFHCCEIFVLTKKVIWLKMGKIFHIQAVCKDVEIHNIIWFSKNDSNHPIIAVVRLPSRNTNFVFNTVIKYDMNTLFTWWPWFSVWTLKPVYPVKSGWLHKLGLGDLFSYPEAILLQVSILSSYQLN